MATTRSESIVTQDNNIIIIQYPGMFETLFTTQPTQSKTEHGATAISSSGEPRSAPTSEVLQQKDQNDILSGLKPRFVHFFL